MFLRLLKDWNGQKAGATVDVPDEFAQALVDAKTAERPADNPLQAVIAQAIDATLTERITGVVTETLQQAAKAARPNPAPWVTSGPVGHGAAGYSYLKASALAPGFAGKFDPDEYDWLRRNAPGTAPDAAGRTLVGVPTLGPVRGGLVPRPCDAGD